MEIATGRVTARCQPRHRHQEFLRFLKEVARAYPDDGIGRELHLVMDNYAAHKRVEIRDWLAANPRMHVHFTPHPRKQGRHQPAYGSASISASPTSAPATSALA